VKKRLLVLIPLLIALGIPAAIWSTQSSPVSVGASDRDEDSTAIVNELDAGAIDYALAIGVDIDEARRRANLLNEARPILDSIRKEASDTLAGLYKVHDPDLRVYLRLTGEPSPALRSIIAESPLPIIVSTNAALSLSESVLRLERAIPGVQSRVPERIGTSIDERTGDVVMDVFIEDDPEQIAEAKARIEAARDSLAQAVGLPVQIHYSPIGRHSCRSITCQTWEWPFG
jgi:hypothetical protein